MAKDISRALALMREGETLPDPLFAKVEGGLRYRCRKTGIFAEYRFKNRDGKWTAKRLGKLQPDITFEGDETTYDYADTVRAFQREANEIYMEGGDPRAGIGKDGPTIARALDLYEADLAKREVARRQDILSLLRYRLIGERVEGRRGKAGKAPRGQTCGFSPERPLGSLTRQDLLSAFAQPGVPRELRSRMSVFLNWAANEGLIPTNVLAGYRAPRATRAQKVKGQARTGRALADEELPVVWEAAGAALPPFDRYIRFLLLTGQRRRETVLLRWPHLDLAEGAEVWTIPAELTKAGREHRVPLPEPALALLGPRSNATDLIFPGRYNRPALGYSRRLAPVLEATARAGLAPWTLHDLRRTQKTGLTALGVPDTVSELMQNREPRDELGQTYDRYAYWPEREEAARLWAGHVMGLVRKHTGRG